MNTKRERRKDLNSRGSGFSPKTEHMWPLLFSLARSRSPSVCHMVKIWAKWGEHLAGPPEPPGPGMPRLLPRVSPRVLHIALDR